MPDHAHQRILEAVQAALVAAATAAGSRVYLDRVDEIPADNLPAIDILGADDTAEDTIEHLTIGFPPLQQHAYSFGIRAVCAQATGAAKAARNLAGQVEAVLLAASNTIAVGAAPILVLLAGSSEVKDGEGAAQLFVVRQQWQAQYQTQGGTPGVPL